jgi:hypothetical protein
LTSVVDQKQSFGASACTILAELSSWACNIHALFFNTSTRIQLVGVPIKNVTFFLANTFVKIVNVVSSATDGAVVSTASHVLAGNDVALSTIAVIAKPAVSTHALQLATKQVTVRTNAFTVAATLFVAISQR